MQNARKSKDFSRPNPTSVLTRKARAEHSRERGGSEGTNTLSLSKIYRRGLLIYRVIILGEIKTVDKLIILD